LKLNPFKIYHSSKCHKNTLKSNKYKTKHIKKHPITHEQNENTDVQHEKKKKWATFIYIGKETNRITTLFKETPIETAFGTRNTIQNIIKPY
jgi:hypothetical protein